jgi:hypothetical protein
MSRNRKWQIVPQFNLSQKQVQRITRLHTQPRKHLLRPAQSLRGNPCPEKRRRTHGLKMAQNGSKSIPSRFIHPIINSTFTQEHTPDSPLQRAQ